MQKEPAGFFVFKIMQCVGWVVLTRSGRFTHAENVILRIIVGGMVSRRLTMNGRLKFCIFLSWSAAAPLAMPPNDE